MRFSALPLALLLLGFSSQSSQAFQILEIRPLDFGIFTITDSGTHSIVVATNGITTLPDGGIHKMRGGHNAIFQITGVDPSVNFYTTINATTLTHSSGSPVFNIDTFTFDPPSSSGSMVHADASGNISFNIGATLHVAPGTPTKEGPYRGTYDFMLNF